MDDLSIERESTYRVYSYLDKHTNSDYRIIFADGTQYIAKFEDAYDSDNENDGARDERDPNYYEYFNLAFRIIKVIKAGPHNWRDMINIDYRRFPSRVEDITNGVVVYPPSGAVAPN